jgi:small-conductance mechanosensitive channel
MIDHFLYSELLNPNTLSGSVVYALLFLGIASLGARIVRILANRSKKRLSDITAVNYVAQLLQAGVFVLCFILYAHLVPALRSLGTALLAGVSVASIVIGLAAQSTLGNLVAGLSLLLYRPFQIGDRVQLNIPNVPNSPVSGTIESLSLGYTILRDDEGRLVIVPNSAMGSAVIFLHNTK